jgi:hypothetical protein
LESQPANRSDFLLTFVQHKKRIVQFCLGVVGAADANSSCHMADGIKALKRNGKDKLQNGNWKS